MPNFARLDRKIQIGILGPTINRLPSSVEKSFPKTIGKTRDGVVRQGLRLGLRVAFLKMRKVMRSVKNQVIVPQHNKNIIRQASFVIDLTPDQVEGLARLAKRLYPKSKWQLHYTMNAVLKTVIIAPDLWAILAKSQVAEGEGTFTSLAHCAADPKNERN